MSDYEILGLADNPNSSGYEILGADPSSGISSIPEDVINSGLNLFMKAGEKGIQLPDEIHDAIKQLYKHPIKTPPRISQGILSGLLEGAKGAYNLPLNLNTYLGSKGVFPFKQTMGLAEKLKIGDTGFKKLVMGEPQQGDQFWEDIGEIAPLAIAPESLSSKVPAVTSKGILKKLSKEKSEKLLTAKKDYSDLFADAESKGLKTANPSKEIIKNKNEIIKNSQSKHHDALKKYLETPTIENAHWAQSELGSLERHFDKIDKRSGLTPSQIKTYKTVTETRKAIKKSMFSNNALGKNPSLALKYDKLANKYKNEVIPYTSLEGLSEFEAGKLRAPKAVQNLLSDEEFMINLSKKHPGIYLHTPRARNIGLGVTGALAGYDELKKLLNFQ